MVLRASIRRDAATLQALVVSLQVRHRIETFGNRIRHQGDISVHVTPSLTLAVMKHGSLGAGLNIAGKTRAGNIKAPQTVYLQSRENREVIVQDQPDQEW